MSAIVRGGATNTAGAARGLLGSGLLGDRGGGRGLSRRRLRHFLCDATAHRRCRLWRGRPRGRPPLRACTPARSAAHRFPAGGDDLLEGGGMRGRPCRPARQGETDQRPWGNPPARHGSPENPGITVDRDMATLPPFDVVHGGHGCRCSIRHPIPCSDLIRLESPSRAPMVPCPASRPLRRNTNPRRGP